MEQQPIPAATLVLIRQQAGGAPELLMVERAARMAFAAGAMVFPGGRIDPHDAEIAADARLVASEELDPEDGAARIAAIRETIEEAGIAVGVDPHPGADAITELRRRLAGGEPFGALLLGARIRLDLARLVPFARWCPRGSEGRIFDTRFYLAASPVDAMAEADGGESVHALWARPEEVLALADAGERHLIFPTRRNLERLSAFKDFEAACADAAAHPVRMITPWIEVREGERWLCISAEHGYPVTAERLSTARRG